MNDILPNSLTKEPLIDWEISRNGMRWLKLFCANCGVGGISVMETELNEQFAFYLCQPCADKYGEIAGIMMVPDEIFWKKIAEAQVDKYGQLLTSEEIAIELQDESSLMSKLKKEIR